MIGAISTALTGLFAASKRVEASASNIANASSANYTPLQTIQTTNESGGAQAVNIPKPAQGYTPGVDFAEEAVNLKLAEISYKASLSVIKAAQDMAEETGRLFDKKA